MSAFDRADSRVTHDDSLAGAIRSFIDRIKAGDLGRFRWRWGWLSSRWCFPP